MEKGGKILRIIVVPLAFLLIAGCIHMHSGVKINAENYIYLTHGWDVCINQDVYTDVSLAELKFPLVGRGDVIVMEQQLPDKAMPNPILKIYNVHSDMKVVLDGKEIYTYGQEAYNAGKVVGYGYHFVELPDDYLGSNIEIIMRISENDACTTLEIPSICNGSYMMRDFISENRLALCIDIFLMMFGLCLAIVSGIFIFRHDGMYKLVCIALFSLCIGLWSLCSYDVITIFTYNLSRKAYLEFGALYLAPTFLFAYFWLDVRAREWKVRKWIYDAILLLQLSFVVGAFLLQAFNIIHLCQLMKISHTLDALMAGYLVYMFVEDIRKRRFENLFPFMGIILMIVLMLGDIFRFNIQKYTNIMEDSHFSNSIYVGALVFVLAMMADFCYGIARKLYHVATSETLEKMAHTDELTGLANRRACEELFDELDENRCNYIIIGFDLNNLKVVNDTLGHEEGDRFIKEFAKILDHVFGEYGLVGRIGGDEFIVMIQNAANVRVNDLINSMNQKIDEKNKEEKNWSMSTAYGICSALEDGVKTSRHAYKVADERMYCKKFEMKECMKHE